MGPKFRYILTYLNEDYVLNYAPRGWDTETIGQYSRSKEMFGMSRKFTLPLTFVKEGAQLLFNAFVTGGYEQGVRLRIEIRESLWNYSTIYLGDLDFSEYEGSEVEVTLPVMESGITADIKAREGITYEFPLVGDDIVNIVLPGVRFDDRLLWNFLPTDASNLNAGKRYVPPINLITQSRSGYMEGFNVLQRNAADIDNFNGDVFIRAIRQIGDVVKFKGNVKGNYVKPPLSLDRFLYLDIRTTNSNSLVYNITTVDTVDLPIGNTPFDIDFEFEYELSEGEGLYVYSRTDPTTSAPFIYIAEGEIEATFATVSDPSNCKGIRPFDLFKRIMNRVSPGQLVNSSLLSITWKNLIITSGSAIRELDAAKIKISLKDFYQGFRGIDDVGMGSENGVFRMETLPFFFRNVEIFNVGNVNRCNTTIANDWVYSSLDIGYKSKETEEQDGRQGFNAGQQWQFPVTRIINPMDLVSTFVADQYEIERLRVQFNVKREASADVNSDNDTFVVHCNDIDVDDNFTPILGSQLQSVTGLSYPLTAYNVLISPKRNLLRHSGYLASMLDLLDTRYIEFASAEKNASITSTVDGTIVIENKSIQVSDLGQKLFRPYLFTINADMPIDAMQRLDLNPFGVIGFNFNGIKCSGFVLESSVDLNGDAPQELKLLCAPTSLIPGLLA